VVSGEEWAIDRSAEWFPVLARRTSVATVQGLEWMPGGAFATAVQAYDGLDRCSRESSQCLDHWSEEFAVPFSHVYLTTSGSAACCVQLREALRQDSSYELIYETADASVFVRIPAETVAPRTGS
jgi:hypothetical protein